MKTSNNPFRFFVASDIVAGPFYPDKQLKLFMFDLQIKYEQVMTYWANRNNDERVARLWAYRHFTPHPNCGEDCISILTCCDGGRNVKRLSWMPNGRKQITIQCRHICMTTAVVHGAG